MKSGQEKKADYEYASYGTHDIFMATEPLKGHRHVKVIENKTKKDWGKYLYDIEKQYRGAEKITLLWSIENNISWYKAYNEENYMDSTILSYEILSSNIEQNWFMGWSRDTS